MKDFKIGYRLLAMPKHLARTVFKNIFTAIFHPDQAGGQYAKTCTWHPDDRPGISLWVRFDMKLLRNIRHSSFSRGLTFPKTGFDPAGKAAHLIALAITRITSG